MNFPSSRPLHILGFFDRHVAYECVFEMIKSGNHALLNGVKMLDSGNSASSGSIRAEFYDKKASVANLDLLAAFSKSAQSRPAWLSRLVNPAASHLIILWYL